jgi:hypothetical protein
MEKVFDFPIQFGQHSNLPLLFWIEATFPLDRMHVFPTSSEKNVFPLLLARMLTFPLLLKK